MEPEVALSKSEIPNSKFQSKDNAATDETRIKHGKQSVFDPCFIRGSNFGFLLFQLAPKQGVESE
jgi:hypothetical protein